MALALGEDRHQHVGARHLFAARRLHMNHRALDHALESGGRLGVFAPFRDQVVQLGFDVGGEAALELVEIDIAGPHHRGGVLVLEQRQQKMLQCGVLVMPLIGEGKRPVERLFEASRKSWHYSPVFTFVAGRPRPVVSPI